MSDDIARDLWTLADEMDDDNPDKQTLTQGANEIERLRAQINIAHNIIGSEAMIWLIVGANHPQAHLDAMRSAVDTYWKAYGNVFRGPDEEARREQ